MIPLGGYGRCHPTPLTPPSLARNITAHKRGERNNKNVICTQILFKSSECGMKRLFGRRRADLPGGFASSNGLFIIPVSHVRLIGRRGVPETRATPAKEEEEEGRDYPRNLDRRQKKRLRQRRKTAARGLALAAWTTQITGDTRMKTFSSPCI